MTGGRILIDALVQNFFLNPEKLSWMKENLQVQQLALIAPFNHFSQSKIRACLQVQLSLFEPSNVLCYKNTCYQMSL